MTAASPGLAKGATFTVRLPVSPVYHADEAGRVHPAAKNLLLLPDCAERLDHVRILVVDDESDTRDLLKAALGECGAEVVTVSSASEAFELIRSAPPDVLISDIGMPLEDGYQLIGRIRALPAATGGRVPAIALTAYARLEDRLKALRSGYQMHVPKPVELAELVAVVLSLVHRRSLEGPIHSDIK